MDKYISIHCFHTLVAKGQDSMGYFQEMPLKFWVSLFTFLIETQSHFHQFQSTKIIQNFTKPLTFLYFQVIILLALIQFW